MVVILQNIFLEKQWKWSNVDCFDSRLNFERNKNVINRKCKEMFFHFYFKKFLGSEQIFYVYFKFHFPSIFIVTKRLIKMLYATLSTVLYISSS